METKYGQYVYTHPIVPTDFGPMLEMVGEDVYKSDFHIMYLPVVKPVLMEEYPHYHNFDMYLTFLGFDPNGLNELGAEIEIGLGKEGEIHKITTPTSVYIPKGMVHCPLNFKRIDKPVLLIHCTMASKYEKGTVYQE